MISGAPSKGTRGEAAEWSVRGVREDRRQQMQSECCISARFLHSLVPHKNLLPFLLPLSHPPSLEMTTHPLRSQHQRLSVKLSLSEPRCILHFSLSSFDIIGAAMCGGGTRTLTFMSPGWPFNSSGEPLIRPTPLIFIFCTSQMNKQKQN